jgi:hypothetical protein
MGRRPPSPTVSSSRTRLSGAVHREGAADVTSNDDRRYAHRTIFDVVRDRLATKHTDVAAFTSWAVQGRLVSNRPEAVVVSASFEPLPPESRVGAGR